MLETLDYGLVAEVITVLLSVVTAIIGPKLNKYVKKYRTIADAIEDGEVTEEEVKKIKKALDKI